MKNKVFKISIIVLGLIIVIGLYFIMARKDNKNTPKITSSPAMLTQFNQLPTENDHFKITYDSDKNVLFIVPKIPLDMSQAPQDFFKQYWKDYESYGTEALQWLNSHQLDKNFRTNFGVKIEWWAQEWWPENATEPTL